MRLPTAFLENRKIQRIIFSIPTAIFSNEEKAFDFMKDIYGKGASCFYLPTLRHLQLFRELKQITEDESLTGICHLDAELGVSLLGKPLHQFESKVISTLLRVLPPHESIKTLLPKQSSPDILTQKEIDRITFNPERLEKELIHFNTTQIKFVLLNGRYGEWLLTLGRIDLIIKIVDWIRQKGFIPIFAGQWTTYFLPKAKSIDVAAYAVPINKKKSLFNLEKACELIKKFEKPVIALNPLADGKLLRKSKEAFLFLFEELKIHATIAEVSSMEELKRIMENMQGVHSVIPPRKA